MNRFLTLASSTLIATGLTVLPAASFAQTASSAATDTVKTPVAATTTTPATQTPVATAAKKDTLTSAQPQPGTQAAPQTQVKPGATAAKGETKMQAHGTKNEVHSMNTRKVHGPAAKTAPVQDQKG